MTGKTMSHRRRGVLVSALAGTSIVVASMAGTAIGAPTQPGIPGANAKCSPEQGVSPTDVKVAIVIPKSGGASSTWKDYDNAVNLRVAQENAKGGVFGRKIITSTYDDQGSGAIQSQVASKALDQDGNFAFLASSTADTMYATLKERNVPVFGLPYLPAYGSDRNAFSPGAFSAAYTNTAWGTLFKNAGVTKLAVVHHNSPGAANNGNGLDASLPSLGITDVLRIRDLPVGSFDATSTALRIKSSGADGLHIGNPLDGVVSIVQALDQQGVKPKLIVSASPFLDPALVARLGSTIEGVRSNTYAMTAPAGVKIPAVRTFVNGMKAKGANPYNPMAAGGFVDADMLIKGLKLAGPCPTRELVISKMRNVSNYDAAGMIGERVSFKPGLTPNGNPGKCLWFVTATNGQPVPDPKPTCGQLMEVATGKIIG